MKLAARDIYKELRLRGYDYGKTFQGILESNNAGNSNVCLCFWNLFSGLLAQKAFIWY